MSHDASKVLFGGILKSFKVVDNKPGTILAGTIVRQDDDGTISIAAAAGLPLGISLGKDLSDSGRTAIVRSGLAVPLKLTAAFTPVLGAQVFISDTTGLGIATGAGATGVNAVYASGLLTGINEDGTNSPAALIDMQGGL
jgi:hypothetical protein